MLVTLNQVLPDARKHGYAVGLFNTVNLEMARGVLEAAEQERSPVIIGTAEILLPFGPMESLAAFLVRMAQEASVPVVLHYDHGLTAEKVKQALELGFTSIMYDRSVLPYEQNVAECAEMAALAHRFGASIEAELGHVGEGSGQQENYTDPAEAAEFVEKTRVDALAVAIGTAHGPYRAKPCLDIERLRCIAASTDTPLVLHGGSGLSDEDFQKCISAGIAKINIFTELNQAMALAASSAYKQGAGMTDLIPEMVKAARSTASSRMRLFGSSGRA